MRDEDQASRAAEESCAALGELVAQAMVERQPELAQWRALASVLQARRPRRWLFVVPAAAALVAALSITSQLSLNYRLENCKTNEGNVVGESGDGTVVFEDGSRFVLARGTQVEIQTRGFRRGAQLRLHRGHTSVSVVHRFARRWDVLAGAFDVHVTGTRFEVDWQPDHSRFDVLVREGEVRVSGGWLKEEIPIRAGQRLDVDGDSSTVTVGPIPSAAAKDKPATLETVRPPAKAPTVAGSARSPRMARLSIARQAAPARPPAPSEQPRLGKPSLVWTGDSFGPSSVGGDDTSSDGASLAGSDGFIFTTIGKRTRFLPPASESPSHLYRQDAMLCTNVRVPALFCSGNSNSPGLESCDWDANWGVVLAWNPRANQRAWGDSTTGRISFEYQGAAGLYRLVAHREGDPDTRLYCVNAYASGQVVSPSDFRIECWTEGGALLPDFSSVDTFALHRPSTSNRQTLKLCISSVSLY